MKKSLYFAFAVAALTLTACNDSYTDWAQPNQINNPQGGLVQTNLTADVAETIDLNTVAGDSKVKLFKTLSVSGAEIDSVSISFGSTVMCLDNDGSVLADELTALIRENYGKAPEVRSLDGTLAVVSKAGDNYYKNTKEVTVTGIPYCPVTISESYKIVVDGTEVDFTHGDQSVYDDPVFSVIVVVEDDTDWSIVDKEGVTYGLEISSSSTSGSLIEGSAAMPGNIPEAGKYKVTINMWDRTYSIEKVLYPEYVFVPGNGQSWNPDTAAALKHEGSGVYKGFVYLDGGFKFTHARNWNDGQYNRFDFIEAPESFNITDDGDGNIICNDPAVYFVELQIESKKLIATKVEKIGLIGDFNGWNDDDVMTWDAENLCYVKEGATVNANGWKFRMNGSWDINYGGSLDDLQPGDADIKVVGTVIKFYPCRTTSNNIYCTVE